MSFLFKKMLIGGVILSISLLALGCYHKKLITPSTLPSKKIQKPVKLQQSNDANTDTTQITPKAKAKSNAEIDALLNNLEKEDDGSLSDTEADDSDINNF